MLAPDALAFDELAPELAPPAFEPVGSEAAEGEDCCDTILAHDLEEGALDDVAAAADEAGTVGKVAPPVVDDEELGFELVLFSEIAFVLLLLALAALLPEL